MNVTQARAAYLNVLLNEVGYVSGNYEWSKYGQAKHWRSPWQWGTESQGFYCARFASWGMDKAFGAKHARLAIGGPQAAFPFPVGYVATWLWRDALRGMGRHQGGWAAAEPGDLVFYLLDGPRKANPTNHVGVFVRWADRPGGAAITVEGNLPKPGHGNSTIGVWYHHRRLDHQVVAVYKPDFEAVVRAVNADKPKPQPEEDDMSQAQYDALLAEIRKVAAQAEANEKWIRQAVNAIIWPRASTITRLKADESAVASEVADKIGPALKEAGSDITAADLARELVKQLTNPEE